MKNRVLGKSGLEVSEIGLGCWQLGGDFGPISDERSQAVLSAAEQSGINFFDTADVYGGGTSESRIGQFTATSASDLLVATKVGRDGALFPDGYSKDRVRANIEGSARRLGVECIDLVQLHCVPHEVLASGELLGWMDDYQQEGLIRAYGASVETIEDALIAARHPGLTSLQIIFNIFRQNAIEDLFPVSSANDVGIIVRLPLASGVLSGKMRRDQEFAPTDHRNYNRHGEAFSQGETFSGVPFEQAVDFVEQLNSLRPEGMSMAQMAMRWILDQPSVTTVITGASRAEQVIENASVSDLAPLPEELHRQLADFYRRHVEQTICAPV